MPPWVQRLGTLLLPVGLLLSPLFPAPQGSQLQVTTAPSSTARVGSGALLQCRFDVGGLVALDFLRVTWYFWEQKLAWYELGRSQDQPGASLPSEKELESGDASLSLAVATVSDEGLYRCVVGYGTQQRQGNTTLHLLAAPTISIPRKPVVADAETSLLCHVGRFFPEDVDVVWMRDGQVLKGSTRSSPHRNTDGTFNLTLTYTFTPTHSDASSIFSCRVRHDALEQPIQQDVPLDIRAGDQTGAMVGAVLGILLGAGAAAAAAIYFWRRRKKGWAVSYNVPDVQVPERCLLGQEVTLHCSMEGTFPEDVAVTWERIHSEDRTVPESAGDQESPEHQPLFPALPPGWRVTEERAGTRLTSSLTFTPTLQDDGARVRCVFLHEAKRIREERVSPEIRVWARPQVSEIQVLPEWDPRDKVPFTVQLHNFYPREVPPIQWGWDGAGSWREDPTQIDKNADGTFTATSVWRVPSRSLTRPELRVRVCVQHGPGEPASERELSLRAAGLLRPPDVSEISRTESMPTGKGVTLSCRITGHFPGELSVTWLRRGKGEDTAVILRDSAECRVEPGTAVLARDGKSFQQETRLIRLSPENLKSHIHLSPKKEKEYSCRVGHLALETPIERSTACRPRPPHLGEVSHPQALVPGQPETLRCLISGFYPGQLAVTWLRKGTGEKAPRPLESSDPHRMHTPAPTWAPDGKSYSVESELRLPPAGPEDDGVEYLCRVQHEALKEPESRSSGRLRVQGHSESTKASNT
ncbi:uncharacterized protein LOC109280625 isoform X2 [Alligator mississippiensis]|uniref:uncharacterized protein LOC109280625 isoform X2 n=1 Tax=Alligator mississippiensis TaxID=8496 RepID=UPI002877D049|nr:uncharacterized protein LOC109280625 isoform X2 [Alligator mississippiensis]XP_059581625.1 uncharacterized protein LOC109280625 isoform X2 [Alligator mississippiensis]